MSHAANSSTTKQWDNCQNLCQEKVIFEELNSTIHNIMAWVVASVTSVLYPVITNSEERVKSNTYPVSAESAPSLDGASCCHTCSDMMIYTRTKTFQRKPYAEAFDRSVEQPTTALIPSSFSKVRTPGKAQSKKNSFMPAKIKFNEALEYPDLKLCKSDTQLFASTECKTKKVRNAATETANLEDSLSSDGETKDKNEKQELVNAFADFKYYIKEETELILQKIFEELMFNLTETIPTLSTAVTDHFFDQTDKDSEKLLDDIDISTAADEIVGTILEKLKYAAEKKCIKAFPQDLSVHFKSDSATSEEHSICCKEVHSEASLPYYFENMGNLTEDIVHVNSQKLMLLAPFKQNQLADLEDIPKSSYQLHMKDPTCTFFQQIGKKKSGAESEAASLTAEGEIQSFVSNILSHSSLLVNLEEAISTTLDFVQMGLNDERLTATKETVLILQLLDDILTQLQ
ncbi:fibrous sheath-interacting protein 2-like [Ochotona princeps]|uniref:fibrous sheath-interacting protein 2-like n=1 Tax=Ochotona princeps TaxID=9978 RepID=UPI002715256E|nr:fibrous sheath-interacting protein 2-like [Ochotona princeps]